MPNWACNAIVASGMDAGRFMEDFSVSYKAGLMGDPGASVSAGAFATNLAPSPEVVSTATHRH